MKTTQKGFSVVESLLMTIIVLLVVFIGYYVWHSQQQTNKTLSSAAATNQAASITKKTVATSSGQQYFTITQWNVRAPYTGSLDLQYTLSSDGTLASVGSKQLAAADPQCVRGGSILRAAPTDPVGADGSTAQEEAQQGATYSLVAGYYYIFVHDQSACSDNDQATTLQTQNNDAVKALVPNLQAIPQ